MPPFYSTLCSPTPGDDCAVQADPASGKECLDCSGVSKTKKKLVLFPFNGSDVENGMW